MNNQYITIEALIEKLQMTIPSHYNYVFNIDEMVTYIYDAMKIIGGNSNYRDNITLKLSENCCKIPGEIEDIIKITYVDMIYGPVPLDKVDKIDPSSNKRYVYMLYNGYIYSDIEEGDIYVDVSILPLDNKGRPYVPNTMYYEKAVLAYMLERIMFKLYLQDQVDERKYERIRQDWYFYCGSAKAGSLLQRRDQDNVFNGSKLTMFSGIKRYHSQYSTEINNIPKADVTDLDDLLHTQNYDPTSTYFNSGT